MDILSFLSVHCRTGPTFLEIFITDTSFQFSSNIVFCPGPSTASLEHTIIYTFLLELESISVFVVDVLITKPGLGTIDKPSSCCLTPPPSLLNSNHPPDKVTPIDNGLILVKILFFDRKGVLMVSHKLHT